MRFLSNEEIGTVTIGKIVSATTINGFDTKGVKPMKILVERITFELDKDHKKYSTDGEWSGYKVSLLTNNESPETIDEKYFTNCTEAEVFIMVGNYMGTVFMRNTMDDFYYLNNIIDTVTGQRQRWAAKGLDIVILPTDPNGNVITDDDDIESTDDDYEDFMDDVRDMIEEDHEELMRNF